MNKCMNHLLNGIVCLFICLFCLFVCLFVILNYCCSAVSGANFFDHFAGLFLRCSYVL
jgi:hypothetical protein